MFLSLGPQIGRIINQASCFKWSPLGAALVWWLEATNENYHKTGAGAVDTKWDITWYYPAGSPTSTELPTWTLGGGLDFMSNQIISSSSSPEHEQLFDWGCNSKQDMNYTTFSTSTTLSEPQKIWEDSANRNCGCLNHISCESWILNQVQLLAIQGNQF